MFVNSIDKEGILANQNVRWEFFRLNAFLSERYRVLLVAVPKAACTSLKWWFAELEGHAEALHNFKHSAETDPDLLVHDGLQVIAPDKVGLTRGMLLERFESADYFRFAVVRNPYKRVFSAWQSKILLGEPNYLDWEVLDRPVKNRADVSEAFEYFLEKLASTGNRSEWDMHWAPQTILLQPNVLPYSALAQLENPRELCERLETHVGRQFTNPFSARRTNESIIPFQANLVTSRGRQLIRNLYEEDFEIFGYSDRVPDDLAAFPDDQFPTALKAVAMIRRRHERFRDVHASHADRAVQLLRGVSGRNLLGVGPSEVWRQLENEVARLKETTDGLRTVVSAHEDRFVKLIRSRSWRLTRPLRFAGRVLRGEYKTAFAPLMERRFAHRLGFGDIVARLLWAKSVLTRSIAVIRNRGLVVFFHKAFWYLKISWQKKAAESRLRSFRAGGRRGAGAWGSEEVLVSFVIPVYDRTEMLRTAIHSSLSQTIVNMEVIIVTDGSPRETLEVISEFRRNPRVRIFNYPHSSGNAVRGRNKGISEARGRYIAFLDSDDVAMPDRLERCLPILESGKADVVYGGWQAIMDGSREVPGIADGQVVLSSNADLQSLLKSCIPCQSTVIIRKSFLEIAGLLKPAMRYREDHELWARLAFHGAVFYSVPYVLTRLRLHRGNNELNFESDSKQWLDRLLLEYKIPGPKPKKIAFLLPGVGISGGIAVVFKHADLLMKSGHDAFVINVGEMGDGSWFPSNSVPIIHATDPRTYLFDGIDLLFATGWSTVDWLHCFAARRKLYFVQSDERRFFDDETLKQTIHSTYLTSCEYLTEAHWIKRMLLEEFGHDSAYVPNGLDTSQFFPDAPLEPKLHGKLRILLEGPISIPFKGMQDAYAAVKGLECEIWVVSSAGRPPADWRCDRFFERVPFGDMRKIYSSCDVFLKMSRVEGFFGPPMEAMACGCAVVVGKVTGYDEYIVDGVNALVVDEGDVQGARRAVERLVSDSVLRKRLIQGGQRTILRWSWERSAEAMLKLVDAPSTISSELDA